MNLEDMLGGSSFAPSPKWSNVGDTHVGVISREPKVTAVVDHNTKQKKYWQSGKPVLEKDLIIGMPYEPMMQIVVSVTLKDGTDATFWIEGEKLKALRACLKEVGLSTIVVGGTLGIQFSEEKPGKGPIPKKLYKVKYAPPKE